MFSLTVNLVPLKVPRMREPEYRRLKKKIETEYREKLDALDMVFRMSGGSSPKNGEQGGRISKGAVSQAVRRALPRMTGEFGVREIEQQIKIDDPTSVFKRASISSTLKRMAEDEDEIVCTKKGKGKGGSQFRKK
jgi:hypothetical protein